MAIPKKIVATKQYAIKIGRPIRLDEDTVLSPSHEEIIVSGETLAKIVDQVLEADERG